MSNVTQHMQFTDDTSAIEVTMRSLNCWIVKTIHDGKTYSDLLGKSKLPLSFLGRPFPNTNAVFDAIAGSFSRKHSRIFLYPKSHMSIFKIIRKKSNVLSLLRQNVLTCPNVFYSRKHRFWSELCIEDNNIFIEFLISSFDEYYRWFHAYPSLQSHLSERLKGRN